MAEPSNLDFASSRAKTIGCFVLIPCFPATVVVSPLIAQGLPWFAFSVGAICSLCGLAALCGRPSQIGIAIRELCRAIRDRWRK